MKVTIDGPSASGKSTVAKLVAKKMGLFHIDTGAIYRSIAWWVMEKNLDPLDRKEIEKELGEFTYKLVVDKRSVHHFVGDRDVTELIRSQKVSEVSSILGENPRVREVASRLQKEIAKDRSIVVEGRDAGTVVFPDAEVKIFLTATADSRAKRRYEELKAKGKEGDLTLEKVIREVEERDDRDREREVSPLRKAPDACSIDTTHMTIKQVVRTVVSIIRENAPKRPSFFWRLLVGQERASAPFVYKIVWMTTYWIYRILYRFEVKGVENYPRGAAIIAPNHVSYLDPPAVALACPGEVHALAADYLFHVRGLKWLLPRLNTYPVARDAGDTKAIKLLLTLLEKKKQVIIFPEGARSVNNTIQPLKRGIALLASMSRCSIVPTYIEGSYKIWPKGKKRPSWRGKITVTFGKPIDWEEIEQRAVSKKEAQQLLLIELENSLKQMQQEKNNGN